MKLDKWSLTLFNVGWKHRPFVLTILCSVSVGVPVRKLIYACFVWGSFLQNGRGISLNQSIAVSRPSQSFSFGEWVVHIIRSHCILIVYVTMPALRSALVCWGLSVVAVHCACLSSSSAGRSTAVQSVVPGKNLNKASVECHKQLLVCLGTYLVLLPGMLCTTVCVRFQMDVTVLTLRHWLQNGEYYLQYCTMAMVIRMYVPICRLRNGC